MDSASINLAKLTKPRFQKILPRKRLLQLLDENRSYPAIWISGPGGSGKTTLTASYIETHKLPCLWYQIDKGDSDIATFFYFLGLAGKKLAPQKEDLPLLTPEYILGISTFTKRFFEQLLDRLKKPGILVLDNYQEVPPDSMLHEVISDALTVIPDNINVFILSRTSPPCVLARARAINILQEIDWPRLRLKIDETRDLFHFFNEKPPSEAFIESLQKKTDGWIAGIILLLKKAESEGINLKPFTEFSAREIFEYFKNEIFNVADRETQEFMLITSIFPRMSVDMAKKLSGSAKTAEILTRIQRNHWFIEQYSRMEIEFQYHPLFREFLLNLAEHSFSRNRLRQLKKQAAKILKESGHVEAAMDLFFESENQCEAIELILQKAQPMVVQGRYQTLDKWLSRLNDQEVQKNPEVLYWLAVCRIFTDPHQSQHLFEKTLTRFEELNKKNWMCLSLSGVVTSITYGFGSFKRFDKWIPRLQAFSAEFDQLPDIEGKARLTGAALLAFAIRQPEHPEFNIWTERGLAILKGDVSADIKSQILVPLLCHRLFAGNFTEAEYFINFFRETINSPSISPLLQITLKNIEAFYFWAIANFGKAQETVDKALDLAEYTGIHIITPLLLGHGAVIALNLGNLSQAEAYLDNMKKFIQYPSWIGEFYHFMNCWKALQEQDLLKAAVAADHAKTYVEKMGMPLTAIFNYLARAVVQHKSRKPAEAEFYLNKALGLSLQLESNQMKFACFLVQAEFALDAWDEATAVEALQKGMAIGKAYQYLTFWLWRPNAMTRLCLKALEQNIEVDYVQLLIRCRGLMPARPPLEIENFPWPLRVYALGRFSVLVDDRPIKSAGKVQEKPLDLLKAIISYGGRDVSINSLSDSLWPEADGDVARGNFKTTLHRLRKLVGYHEAIYLNSGSATVDQRYCWVDAWAFERNLSTAEEFWESSENDLKSAAELTQKAVDLYKGPLFRADDDWAIPLRDHLHNRFVEAVQQMGKYRQSRNEWEAAIKLYETGLKIDELVEPFYRGLMVCNHYLGRNAKALAAYERCETVFSDRLAVPPSAKTESLKKHLFGQKNK